MADLIKENASKIQIITISLKRKKKTILKMTSNPHT